MPLFRIISIRPITVVGKVAPVLGVLSAESEREDCDMKLARGGRAICRFKFLYRPEYLKVGVVIVFREGRTTGVGTVTGLFLDEQQEL